MARQRRQRRKHRELRSSGASAELLYQFSSHAHQQHLEEAVNNERNSDRQRDHLRRYRELEEQILARTVYVTYVRDLNRPENLEKLRLFMEQRYGPVEDCFIANDGGSSSSPTKRRYPPARVRFQRQSSALSLLRTAEQTNGRLVPSPEVGHKHGCIRVMPSRRDHKMLNAMLSDSVISFSANRMEIGHWLMGSTDTFNLWQTKHSEQDEWFEEGHSTTNSISITVDLKQRTVQMDMGARETTHRATGTNDLSVLFDVLFPSPTQSATFRFKDLDGCFELCQEPGVTGYSLIFTLKYAPKLHQLSRQRIPSLDAFDEDHLGECLSFKLLLSEADIDRLLLSERLSEMKDFGLLRDGCESVQYARTIRSFHIGRRNEELLAALSMVHQAEPEIGFLLRSLLDRGRFSWYHALRDKVEFEDQGPLNIFYQVQIEHPRAAVQALREMLDGCGRTKYPCRLFCSILTFPTLTKIQADYCVTIPRVILTPSRQVVVGLEDEVSNRVVRRFVETEGFRCTDFMRLRVVDEDEDRLYYNVLNEHIVAKLKATIMQGIVINGVQYSFLGYSSSQLKELSVWMVAPPSGLTVKDIRTRLGNFSGMTAPRFAARMGQCFSTTVQTLGRSGQLRLGSTRQQQLLKPLVVPDISSLHDGREMVHSDGTGYIRQETMDEVLQLVPWTKKGSIIQIRCGGSKGTLTVMPEEIRSKLPPRYSIALRPSMIKFEAPMSDLEVCRVGTQVPYYLNRHVVLLLGVHGIQDRVFLDLQNRMLDDLDSMMTSRQDALRMTGTIGGPDQGQRSTLLHMLQTGFFFPKRDPFLFSCLLAIRAHHLFGLRKKTRIFIEKGAVLLGGLDETGFLEEGCVFVQLSGQNTSDEHDTPILGPVLVTKHPVTHPGDVRMLLAIDIPELRHLENVIIFSQKGTRPEADKMSGSDLDGDEFAVTWDPRLFLNGSGTDTWDDLESIKEEIRGNPSSGIVRSLVARVGSANYPPLGYEAPGHSNHRALPDSCDAQSEGLLDHFFSYAQNDSLGYIATLWLDYAAQNTAECEECLELAKLHSISVDFAKTGCPARVPPSLEWQGPKAHWRELKHHPAYHCEGVIGKLYDDVIGRKEIGFEKACSTAVCGRIWNRYGQILARGGTRWDTKFLEDVFDHRIPEMLGLPLGSRIDDITRHLLVFAESQRELYENQVAAVMNRFHLRTEGEFFTGCIRKYHRLDKKRQNAVAEDVRRQCHTIQKEFRTSFFRKVLEIASGADYLNEESDSESTQEREDDDTEMIEWTERIATQPAVVCDGDALAYESIVPKMACALAAAYYSVTYSPERAPLNHMLLFSFPWIVADVIACGLNGRHSINAP